MRDKVVCYFICALGLLMGGCRGGSGSGSVTGSPGTVQFSAATYSVNENGGSATITVTRIGGGTASVNFATSDGTGVSGTDYTANSGTLNWASGDAASKTFTVAIIDRNLTTGTHTVNLTLSNFSGATAGTTTSATLTIDDQDGPGTLQFSTSAYSVNENAGTATITVTRLGGSGGAAAVDFATSDGTGTAGTDYNANSGTLNWASGDTASKTFTVTILDRNQTTGTHTVNLTLSGYSGSTAGTPTSATLTIDDQDGPGTLQFSASAYSVNENGASVTIAVTRTGGSGGAASVNFATSDGTGVAGADYTASSGTLNWTSGDTASKTFTVSIIDRNLTTGTHTIDLTLSAFSGATAGSPTSATITIDDNDSSTACTGVTGTSQPRTSIDAGCESCSASNPDFAVDGNLGTFATLTVNQAAPGMGASIRATAQTGIVFPPGQTAGAYVSVPAGDEQAYSVTIRTLLGGVVQESAGSGNTINAHNSGQPSTFNGLTTTKQFDAVEVFINNNQTGGTPTFGIYEICSNHQ